MFKNLQVYRLQVPLQISLEQLEEQLGRNRFAPCPSNQPKARGWFPPRANANLPDVPGAYPLVHSVGGQWLINLVMEDKIMPASVVNQEVEARVAVATTAQGYAPGRKQKREIKERVIEEMLPTAMAKRSAMSAWINPVEGWLVINASSRGKADTVLEQLRMSLDVFPVRPLHTQISAQSAMADWLASGTAPDGFSMDRDCELKSPAEEKATVRYVRHSLDNENVQAQIREHLSNGKLPTRLAMTWDDRISFVLTETLELKRIALLDILTEQSDKDSKEGMEIFDADFALTTGELRRMLPHIVAALGGEVTEES